MNPWINPSPTAPDRRAAFTLVELVVTIGVIAIVTGASLALLGIQKNSRFQAQANLLLDDLRTMQGNSRSVLGNREYGIEFTSSSWTTFSREPATGSQTNLETHQLDGITLTATLNPAATRLVFERLSGQPKNATQTTLTLRMSGKTRQITVSSAGVIHAP